MSWQAYVDTNLLGSGKVTHAAILGQKGGIWASSKGFNLSQEEQNAIIGLHSKPDLAQANGFRLAGDKYFTLQANERSIYGKKQANGAVIVKTTQAILVTVYEAPIQQTESTTVVEALADYLISVGY
ncbi:profilin [Irpex lacteus]|nr:profilin [Irpex lacteus]